MAATTFKKRLGGCSACVGVSVSDRESCGWFTRDSSDGCPASSHCVSGIWNHSLTHSQMLVDMSCWKNKTSTNMSETFLVTLPLHLNEWSTCTVLCQCSFWLQMLLCVTVECAHAWIFAGHGPGTDTSSVSLKVIVIKPINISAGVEALRGRCSTVMPELLPRFSDMMKWLSRAPAAAENKVSSLRS